jgi:hypothetical protein
MKSVALIQPGKLGDIIICLPIAKYYYDRGYKVIWPIFADFVPMLTEVIDYVEFIPVTNNVYHCVDEAKLSVAPLRPEIIFDIAATFPGSACTEEYVKLGDGLKDVKFDYFKYMKCNVPFELKWNLELKINSEKEDQIIKDLVKQQNYDVVSVSHSRGALPVKFESKNQIIVVNEKYNIFNWRKILTGAKSIALVDSAMANLVEQLNINTKKILLLKPGHPTPTFKNNWIIKTI